MLHNNRDIAEPNTTTTAATATPITTTTAAAATTEGNGTEPTIATHLATTSAAAAKTSAGVGETSATAEGQTPVTTTTAAVAERTKLAQTADATAAPIVDATAAAAAATEATAFDAQMRTQQRHKIKIYHDAKQTAVWRTDSLASNPSSTICPDFVSSGSGGVAGGVGGTVAGGGVTGALGLPPRGIILSTAPSLLQRKSSDSSLTSSIARRVSFPDNQLVTGYLEPANPWKQGEFCHDNLFF